MINRKEGTNNFGSFVKVNIIIMGASTTYTESQVQPETVKAIFKALRSLSNLRKFVFRSILKKV
ncbi:hypothetical protein [Sphingobacterium thalpophilum]|uniref:hypothetical protein n=1 Tax=Sphingobacterium thalpophilum TaxID=259 RepID=UPI002D7804B4|nr:hypothetical protein [Sphingobacterium thalpophilum]